MPSLGDSAFIFLLALLLFGPKKLPELARQIGKLMGEFRRASNEFRMQMEDELRISEQAERQKQIAAMEAAAPVAPALPAASVEADAAASASVGESSVAAESSAVAGATPEAQPEGHAYLTTPVNSVPVNPVTEPLPIATSGDLSIMPPATGLPAARAAAAPLDPVLNAIPHTPAPENDPIQHASTTTTTLTAHPAEAEPTLPGESEWLHG